MESSLSRLRAGTLSDRLRRVRAFDDAGMPGSAGASDGERGDAADGSADPPAAYQPAILLDEIERSGVRFAADGAAFEDCYYRAMRMLLDCVRRSPEGTPALQEGGVYAGCWLESTGTINSEILARFMPLVAQSTFDQFASHRRSDGLIPYKVTASGPSFRQIQMVTPLARSVWNSFRLREAGMVSTDAAEEDPHGLRSYLGKMYAAIAGFDAWLAEYRNTRGTGCVEAFATFDTGHDLSARFWHVPDTPYLDNPAQYDPSSPILPFLAPDLTANVYCQRKYLASISRYLSGNGIDSADWDAKAQSTLTSLLANCFHEEDGFFYDYDRNNQYVRIQSDVLLRVLACEVGDDRFFESSLRRYLLNTRKFFAKYPFTSVAMDDPRFDPSSTYNTWSGATNFLSIIRAAHAFEHHGRFVELTWLMQPVLSALSRMTLFGQCISPWTGKEGYTESYSPTLLCMLDFVERLCGILPTPEGEIWFTGLLPTAMDHGTRLADETSYSRTVRGTRFELVNSREHSEVYVDGTRRYRFPHGLRVVTDENGELRMVVGMMAGQRAGTVTVGSRDVYVEVGGNERLEYANGAFRSLGSPGVVVPSYE